MTASKLNQLILLFITLFMAIVFVSTSRTASEIAILGGSMAILNSGVPINIMLDKIIFLSRKN